MKFTRVNWSPEIAARLARAMRYDDDVREIGAQVHAGICECYSIDDGASFIVTRREATDLVVVLFAGVDTLTVAKHCMYAAKKAGLPFVRFHTTSVALVRLLRPLSPEPVEYVMRLGSDGQQIQKLDNGQSNDHERTGH